MSYFGAKDFLIEVQKGNVSGHSITHKFGAVTVGTSELDVWSVASTYPFTATFPTALNISSTSSNDAGGAGTESGAQIITVSGLDNTWAEQSLDVVMDGATVVAVGTQFARVNRAFVKDAGKVGNTGRDSNEGTITIQGSDRTLAEIDHDGTRGYGQTQMAIYTVPLAKTGYVLSASVNVDSNKDATFYLWQRLDADDTTVPVRGKRLIIQFDGVAEAFSYMPHSPLGPFAAQTDLWWSVIASGAGTNVSVDFEILLVDD